MGRGILLWLLGVPIPIPMSNAEHFLQDTWKSLRLASEANGSKELDRYAELLRRLTELSTIPLNANETIAPHPTKVPCPKCGTGMALKAVLPHPIIAGMKRHGYVCASCDRARMYYQPSKPSQISSRFNFRSERARGVYGRTPSAATDSNVRDSRSQ
jgi:hypothetical protein